MGAPIGLSKAAQAATGLGHFSTALETLKNYKFEEVKGSALIRKEPIGVVGMIIAIPLYTAFKVIGKVFFSENTLVKKLTKNL